MKRHYAAGVGASPHTGDTDVLKRAKMEDYLERLRIAKLQMLFKQEHHEKCFNVTRTPISNLFSK